MSFDLSCLSHEFIVGHYDFDNCFDYPIEKPKSIYQTVNNLFLDKKEWARMVGWAFGEETNPDTITINNVMDQIEIVETVDNLDTPVRVWVDSGGWFTIEVY